MSKVAGSEKRKSPQRNSGKTAIDSPACRRWRHNDRRDPSRGTPLRLNGPAYQHWLACQPSSPISGGELGYRPGNWNNHNQEGLNCYDYAVGHYDPDQEHKSQPGEWSHTYRGDPPYFTCPLVEKRIRADHPALEKANFQKPCSPGRRKIAMMINSNPEDSDYHFMRQDRTGRWSHKMGQGAVTNLDGSGRLIQAPHLANRKIGSYNYKQMCGYYCVPKEARKKVIKRGKGSNREE